MPNSHAKLCVFGGTWCCCGGTDCVSAHVGEVHLPDMVVVLDGVCVLLQLLFWAHVVVVEVLVVLDLLQNLRAVGPRVVCDDPYARDYSWDGGRVVEGADVDEAAEEDEGGDASSYKAVAAAKAL